MANEDQTTQAAKNELLKVFIGKWHTTGEIVGSDAEVDAIDTYEWLPGNYSIIHYADAGMGEDKFSSIEIIGYVPSRGAFFCPFFDDQGGGGFEEADTEDGKVWHFHGENIMGVNFHRCTLTVSDDGNALEAIHEQSEDGTTWQPWMNVVLNRMS